MAKSKTRGFAGLPPEKRQELARKGGTQAHRQGVANAHTPEEARAAGRIGGKKVARDREHMREIGRLGGQAKGRNRKARGE